MTSTLPPITERRRLPAPCASPQALAWHAGALWISSRDDPKVYRVDAVSWRLLEERDVTAIAWAAVSTGDGMAWTLGEGQQDDRYVWRSTAHGEFLSDSRIACPDFAGSYLSFDGAHVYLSQWYKQRVLQLGAGGEILRTIDVGAEICGHTFVGDMLYVLRGTEAGDEDWRLGRLDPRREAPDVEDVAKVPFQCRSLAHDGELFWSNHRRANETVAFSVPGA